MGGYWIMLLAAGAVPIAPPSTAEQDADAARTVDLNRAIQQHNDAIRDRNAAAEEAYRRDRAAYEAAKAQNDRETAVAAAAERAYRTERAEHEAAMARWRATVGSSAIRVAAEAAPAVEAPAPTRKLVCRDEAVPGSLARHVRRCH